MKEFLTSDLGQICVWLLLPLAMFLIAYNEDKRREIGEVDDDDIENENEDIE